MIGDRIKLKRNANRLSLQEFSHNLSLSGFTITNATLSNYENGKTIPSPEVQSILAEELGVSPDFFTCSDWDSMKIVCFCGAQTIPKKEIELLSYLQVKAEQQLTVDSLLGLPFDSIELPREIMYSYYNEQIEQVAERFRQQVGAGQQPIHSVTNLLENSGWYIFELPKSFDLAAISGSCTTPDHLFVAFTPSARVDELRYSLLKAVGYAYFSCPDADLLDQVTSGFAKAVLLPESQIAKEIGLNRKEISFAELSILKKKYGLSRLKIASRLNELGIFPKASYDNLQSILRRYGHPLNQGLHQEPLTFYESPEQFKQKLLRAQSEGIIDRQKAALFHPFPFMQT